MTRFLRRQRPVRLTEGQLYRVKAGPKKGFVFYVSFGHKRALVTLDDCRRLFAGTKPIPVQPELEATLPVGPHVPTGRTANLVEVLAEAVETMPIRQALCQTLHGSGFEIGAGDRPSPVPIACHVSYVDRFTFDEAADGSFVGKDPANFVRVTIFESIEHMPSIPDASADFFIACHVIEHVSDPVAAFEELYRKVKVDGQVVMVVPDGRYTFDAGRPPTTLEHLVAHRLGHAGNELEHYLEYFRRAAHEERWVELAEEGLERGRDIHKHVFTPDSMRELLSYFHSDIPFSNGEVLEPAHGSTVQEFYVVLAR